MKLDEIIRTGLSRVDTVRVVRTGINPLLWLVGLTTPIALVFVAIIDNQLIRLLLVALAVVPVLATLVAYFIFLIRDPDRLQSEDIRCGRRFLMLYSGPVKSPIYPKSRGQSVGLTPRILRGPLEKTNEDLSAGV